MTAPGEPCPFVGPIENAHRLVRAWVGGVGTRAWSMLEAAARGEDKAVMAHRKAARMFRLAAWTLRQIEGGAA